MIQTIEQATQTRIMIGQNGIIVVTGKRLDGTQLAIRAIKMVEEEAHMSNLTQRIKTLLNVSDGPQTDVQVNQLPENQKDSNLKVEGSESEMEIGQ
jgi:exosome complex RNA-binding protein Rrp4